ncbi:MAG: zinc-ribbon domain-containing protein [Candidatus Woesearchaeota archaeon]
MVFNQNLVAVIKHNGRVLRETRNENDAVHLPFGSEYSVLIKNLNTVKALVNVEIDGREAISGLIVNPNEDVELERFFENDLSKGHKFKFIEKSDDIKEYRGDKIEDGIVRITYQFESKFTSLDGGYWHKRWPSIWDKPDIYFADKIDKCPYKSIGGFDHTTYYYGNDTLRSYNYTSNGNVSQPVNDEGITVEGGYSSQSFTYGNIGILNPEVYCINIQLKGYYPNKGKVKKPVTTKTKFKCDYCGKTNRSNNKFCPNCGAALI